jgi:hypothetical protein
VERRGGGQGEDRPVPDAKRGDHRHEGAELDWKAREAVTACARLEPGVVT